MQPRKGSMVGANFPVECHSPAAPASMLVRGAWAYVRSQAAHDNRFQTRPHRTVAGTATRTGAASGSHREPLPERVDQRRRISDVVLVSGEALRIHAEAVDEQPADFYATQPRRARELRDQNRGRRR